MTFKVIFLKELCFTKQHLHAITREKNNNIIPWHSGYAVV